MSRRRLARRPLATVLVAAAALGLSACGASSGSGGPDYRLVTPPRYEGAQPIAVPTPGIEWTMHAEDAKRLKPVIDGWSTAVRKGEAVRATHYFALPTVVFQPGTGAVVIEKPAIAERFNASFPCGAKLLSTRADGRYIVATFQLVSVPGRTCTTPKALVKVGFVFGDKKRPNRFTEWWRVADTPGAPPGPDRRPAAPIAGPKTFG